MLPRADNRPTDRLPKWLYATAVVCALASLPACVPVTDVSSSSSVATPAATANILDTESRTRATVETCHNPSIGASQLPTHLATLGWNRLPSGGQRDAFRHFAAAIHYEPGSERWKAAFDGMMSSYRRQASSEQWVLSIYSANDGGQDLLMAVDGLTPNAKELITNMRHCWLLTEPSSVTEAPIQFGSERPFRSGRLPQTSTIAPDGTSFSQRLSVTRLVAGESPPTTGVTFTSSRLLNTALSGEIDSP